MKLYFKIKPLIMPHTCEPLIHSPFQLHENKEEHYQEVTFYHMPEVHKATHLYVLQCSAVQRALLQGLVFLEGKVLLHLWCDFRDAFP